MAETKSDSATRWEDGVDVEREILWAEGETEFVRLRCIISAFSGDLARAGRIVVSLDLAESLPRSFGATEADAPRQTAFSTIGLR